MKTILCVENAAIVPSLNYEVPNPRLRLEEWCLKVPTKTTAWPTKGVRRASITSFGYGGSNAHCIIDDAYNYLKSRGFQGNTNSVAISNLTPPDTPDEDVDSGLGSVSVSPTSDSPASDSKPFFSEGELVRPKLFVLSAFEQITLQAMTASYGEYLDGKNMKNTRQADAFLANLAYTLGHRRTVFSWRTSFVASSMTDLATSMNQKIKSTRAGKAPKIVFIFTGQGAQWFAMGRELLSYEVFADAIDEADQYLKTLGAEWSVLSELTASEEESQVYLAKFSQPLCVILQIALVKLLQHWGIMPAAVIGHSSGEIGQYCSFLKFRHAYRFFSCCICCGSIIS
jgi:acyl transferase domain-containing protein